EHVDRAQLAHGSAILARSRVVFTFRGTRYEMERNRGGYAYRRNEPNGRQIELSNHGVTLSVGGQTVPLDEKSARGASETVNSVVYFASLPLALTDPAVKLIDAGEETIKGETYHRVRVTFRQEGGGADHDDIFMYWFRERDGVMDYLAYSYRRNGGGIRFRVATHAETIEGIRFQDYDNYEVADLSTALESLPQLWTSGALSKLSEIKTEDVCVVTAERRCS
ncbi:MAG: DUF6503 family protein, partial [Myxococcota bacterium]